MSETTPDLGELELATMQLIWQHGPSTAESVREQLDRPLKESTVRTVLRRLEEKGYLTHTIDQRTFTFHATEVPHRVAAKAVKRVVDWFCKGSVEELLVGMIDSEMLDGAQLDALARRIEQAKEERRK